VLRCLSQIVSDGLVSAESHRPSESNKSKYTLAKEGENLKENKMKTLQRLCAGFVLTLALTPSVFAGDMSTGITAPPPPPDSQSAATGDMSTTVTGDMSTGVTDIDPVTEVALNLLQNLPPLF
jgi:hypothetical protein